MRPCFHVEIVTPKKTILDGLWLGSKNPKRVLIWIHGLGSSMFRKLEIMDELVDSQTAVLTFNNRGHDNVTRARSSKGKTYKAGAAHEVFTDCIDDIEGAIRFARSRGATRIYLAGHSTGCQKSVYWAAKKGKGVKGIFLLSPISDYDSELTASGKAKLKRAENVARGFVRKGKTHELLPENVWGWPWIADAQRFLSLYTGKGSEEQFTYWDPNRDPRALRFIKIPILVLLGELEEHTDKPVRDIAAWFDKRLKYTHKVVVIPNVGHSFRGAEKRVAREMVQFMKEA